jgi:hypothetical protein
LGHGLPGSPRSAPNSDLVSFGVGPELHVQPHGFLELLPSVHCLPNVVDEAAFEDLLVQVSVPKLQGFAYKRIVVRAGDAGALRQLVVLQGVDDVRFRVRP